MTVRNGPLRTHPEPSPSRKETQFPAPSPRSGSRTPRLAEVWEGVLARTRLPGTPALPSTAPPPTFLSHHEALLHRPHLTEQLLQLLTAGGGRQAAHKQGQPGHEARGPRRTRSQANPGLAREARIRLWQANHAKRPGDSGSARCSKESGGKQGEEGKKAFRNGGGAVLPGGGAS